MIAITLIGVAEGSYEFKCDSVPFVVGYIQENLKEKEDLEYSVRLKLYQRGIHVIAVLDDDCAIGGLMGSVIDWSTTPIIPCEKHARSKLKDLMTHTELSGLNKFVERYNRHIRVLRSLHKDEGASEISYPTSPEEFDAVGDALITAARLNFPTMVLAEAIAEMLELNQEFRERFDG
jgi:hypothetical protein